MTPEAIRDLDYEDSNGFLHTHNELQIIIFREIAAQLAELNERMHKLMDEDNFGEGKRAYFRVMGAVSTSSE